MQLQNFECQIAKAQIGRYVAGDALSDETVQQLESHIGRCPDCKQNLAERRAVLQAMLSPTEAVAPSEPETPSRAKFDLASFVKSKIQAKQPVQAAVQTAEPKPNNFTKPTLYSLALGAVLIGMSYASKNLGSMLGPKAEQRFTKAPATIVTPPSNPKPKLEKAPAPAPKIKPAPKAATPIQAPPESTPLKPSTTRIQPEVEIKTSRISKPRKTKRQRSYSKAPRPATNTIRVYNPEN